MILLNAASFAAALLVPSTVVAIDWRWPSLSPHSPAPSKRTAWKVGQSVKTANGIVNGHPAPNNSAVSEYLGIPYAQPPVGSLRWQDPVKSTGVGIINGTNFAKPLLSATTTRSSITVSPRVLPFPPLPDTYIDPSTPQSEDCLTLNIWTQPQTGDASKAVFIWIHGGSFTSGSSRESWYNGEYLSAEQDVIVVSINYRLNIFGFPGNPTSPTNLGLLDQRMAVEWVRDNIAGFGGDPKRMILFGQSAGAASVDIHSYAWASDPVVSGYIPESGTSTGFGLGTPAQAADLWYNASSKVGCGGDRANANVVYACMLNQTSTHLADNVPAVPLGDTNGLPFGPVIDEKVVFADYNAHRPANLPMLIGNTDDESALFQWLAPDGSRVPQSYWDSLNNQGFTCPAAMRASVNVLLGNPTWRYRWFGVFPNLVLNWFPAPSGAWHGSELPSVFNTTPPSAIPNTMAQNAVGTYMRGAWAAFAKDPVNGLTKYTGVGAGGLTVAQAGWPKYSTTGQTLVRLAFDDTTGPNLDTGNAYDQACSGVPTVTTGPTATGTATAAASTATATSAEGAGGDASAASPGLRIRYVSSDWLKLPSVIFCFWSVVYCAT